MNVHNIINIALLFAASGNFVLAVLVVFRKQKHRSASLFAWFCLSVGLWALGIAFFRITPSLRTAYFWNQEFIFSAGMIPILFVHFAYAFINKHISLRKKVILYAPIIFLLAGVLVPNALIKNIVIAEWGKESILGYCYPLYGIYFSVYMAYGFVMLLLEHQKAQSLYKLRLRYILFAVFPASLIGAYFNLYLILMGDYRYIWAGPQATFAFVIITAYAIYRYRLMDIKLIITRLGIFIFVYSVVLGIPFGLAIGLREWLMGLFGQGWFWAPMVSLLILATAGPFIYLYIQKRAEDTLLQEQRQYQNTLRQASIGMARIKDINKLLNLMVHIVSRTVRIDHCAIYLLDGTKGNYALKSSRGIENNRSDLLRELEADSALIQRLKEKQEIIICEEIRQQAADVSDEHSEKILATIRGLGAELIVPSLDNENLIAILVLGKKKSGEIYSPDDLLVFSILANQSALGIENALFYEETGKNLAEKFHEKRLKFLGELGSGVAHQINNRFGVVSVAAGMGLALINKQDIRGLSQEELVRLVLSLKEILMKIETASLKGKEIADAIKTYSRASVVPSAVTIDRAISSSLNLLSCKFKIERLNLKQEYASGTYVWANLSTLQEVIANAIDNSHDAMTTKEKMVKAKRLDIQEDYTPELIIQANPLNGKLVIEIMDNGIGMTPEQLEKVFVPFFTTKGANKGTGMGLNMMKQLLEKNNGTIAINSEYGKGTTVTLSVALATEEQINTTKNETDES